jgi:hypothetical protein
MRDNPPYFTGDLEAIVAHLLHNGECQFTSALDGHGCREGECDWTKAADAARSVIPTESPRPADEPDACPWCRQDIIDDREFCIDYVCGTRLGKQTKYEERSLDCRIIEARHG